MRYINPRTLLFWYDKTYDVEHVHCDEGVFLFVVLLQNLPRCWDEEGDDYERRKIALFTVCCCVTCYDYSNSIS